MKTKKLFLMATMLLMSVCSFAQNSNTPLKGDVNGDGKVDVADIVAILKIMKDAGVTQYTVTYHSNGGNSTPAPQTVNAGETVTLAGAISRNADSSYTYEFSYWNSNTGTSYDAGQTISVNDNIDLYAQWNKTAITPVTPTTEYYWYIGPTDPLTMTSISPIVTNNSSPGWREIGTTLPTYSSSNMLWNNSNTIGLGSKTTWYLALPSNTIKVYSAGIDLTNDLLTSNGTKVINGITYYLYTSKGTTRNLGYDLY